MLPAPRPDLEAALPARAGVGAAVLLLHLAPGALVWAVHRLGAPLLAAHGVPPRAALLGGFLVAGLPLQLAVLRRAARARGITVRALVSGRRAPLWQHLLAAPALLAWAIAATAAGAPAAAWLGGVLGEAAPFLKPPPAAAPPLPGLVVATLGLKLVVDGLLNPVVEEAYFRGYLLPRLAPLGPAAPLVNAALFALAHLWQLENAPVIVLYGCALAYVAWWRGTIAFGVVNHALVNLLGTAVALHAAVAAAPPG